jgi:anti-sigma B factor antagonist
VRRLESTVLEHAGASLGDDLCIVAARDEPVTDTFEPAPFGIELARDGATATVAVLGEFDLSSTPELMEGLRSLEPGYETLVVDLSRCTFFASSGISILLQESHRAKEEGFELVVIKAPADVQRMFDLVALDDILTFRDP